MQELAAATTNLEDDDAEQYSDFNTYLSFHVGNETYAIEIKRIKEIIEYEKLTRVPMVSNLIEGVINLRGNVVPIINLANHLDIIMDEYDKRTSIVMIEVSDGGELLEIGFVVSSVSAVLDICSHDIEPKPSFGCNIKTEYIKGMAKVENGFLILLNLDTLFKLDSLIELI
jgi:purine-binding chemotaxis protein CheW